MNSYPIDRLVNLLSPDGNVFLNATQEEAEAALSSGDVERVRAIDGQFALIHKDGITVRMARSIGRPMRYFMAKLVDGPCLVVAERMSEIRDYLQDEGLGDQFHPSYTRMVPAHFVVEIQMVGCPDPNPVYKRFFEPDRNVLDTNLDHIGARYIGEVDKAVDQWLDTIDPKAPIGVLFSGGIDSGAVFLTLYNRLLQRGESPARLKAFTLSVQGGSDPQQAYDFMARLDLGLFLEVVEVALEDVDYKAAIRVIEDYKPLDVQAAAMTWTLVKSIRERYPDWKYLVDGDGGDENLKDYPIEENPELTIRSVLNNSMLYHEGWGVFAMKHSLTYSGGQSRGHVRSYAPVRMLGFKGFSPFTLPNVIEVSEGIPFIDLTDWDHDRLYALKGEVVCRGVKAVTGLDMPLFEKQRFQRGAVDEAGFDKLFPKDDAAYRQAFAEIYGK